MIPNLTQPIDLSKVRMLVFDLDGTLVDSMTHFTDVAADVMKRFFGVDAEEARRMYRDTSGLPFEFQLKRLFGADVRIDEASKAFESEKITTYGDSRFYDDVRPALQKLRQNGYLLAVSSNNHEANVVEKLSKHLDLFDRILGYHPGFLKGRDHFLKLQSEFELDADQMLFIGDSLHDCRTAKDNDLKFVARLGTFSAQDFAEISFPKIAVTDFDELFDCLCPSPMNQEGVTTCKS